MSYDEVRYVTELSRDILLRKIIGLKLKLLMQAIRNILQSRGYR